MHPFKSITAHQQRWATKNFIKTKYAKKLKTLKNLYKGDTCFIVGNGPSLTTDDLTKIYKLGIFSFGLNRIFCVFDDTPWRPNCYISQDINTTFGMEKDFLNLNLPYRFHPIRWKWFDNFDIKKAYYYKTVVSKNTEYLDFSKDFSEYVIDASTVAYTAFQLAYYMGFKRIYLIGVDQNYKKAKDKDGNIVVNKDLKKEYVSDKYLNSETDDLNIPNLFEMNKAFISVDKQIKNGNIDLEVYNATRGGMLEVFERKDLDEVFKELSK
jgi:hypothetical protein